MARHAKDHNQGACRIVLTIRDGGYGSGNDKSVWETQEVYKVSDLALEEARSFLLGTKNKESIPGKGNSTSKGGPKMTGAMGIDGGECSLCLL